MWNVKGLIFTISQNNDHTTVNPKSLWGDDAESLRERRLCVIQVELTNRQEDHIS